MKLQIKKLNAEGFAHHFLLPVVAIVAVVGIGSLVMLRLSHAATTAGYYNGPCVNKTFTSGQNGAPCITQVQDLLDGAQHAKLHNLVTASKASGDTFTYGGNQYYLLMNGIYNGATQAAVSAVIKADGKSTEVSTLNGGTAASADWQMLCTALADIGVSSNTDKTLNFAGAKNSAGKVISPAPHTNSSMKTIFSNTCGSKTSGASGGKSSGSASKSSAASLSASVTVSPMSARPGDSVTIKGVVTNNGSVAAGNFYYGLRDFYSDSIAPATSTKQPYGEFAVPGSLDKRASGLKQGATVASTASLKLVTSPTHPYICYAETFGSSNGGVLSNTSAPVCLKLK